jgi:hypothetical protein
MYWKDVKYCPHKKIFQPKNICEDFKKEVEKEEYVNRRDDR